MSKTDLILRAKINAPLTTKGSELDFNDFDCNIVEIYNALVALSISSNIAAWDAAKSYFLNAPVVYSGQLYKCIVVGPVLAITPGTDPAKWEEIYASDLVEAPKGYTSYSASLTQTATNAPVVNFEKNQFPEVATWTYLAISDYNINIDGAFPDANKIQVFGGVGKNNQVNLRWTYAGANDIRIHAVKPDDATEVDGLFALTSIEIRVND